MKQSELTQLVRDLVPEEGALVAGPKGGRRLKSKVRKALQAAEAQYQTIRGSGYLVKVSDGLGTVKLEFYEQGYGLVKVDLTPVNVEAGIIPETYTERTRNPGAMANRNKKRKEVSRKRKQIDPLADLPNEEWTARLTVALEQATSWEIVVSVPEGDDYWLTYSVDWLRTLKKSPEELATEIQNRAQPYDDTISQIRVFSNPYDMFALGPIPTKPTQL